MTMSWLLIGALTWCVLAPAMAVVIGLAFRMGTGDARPAAWTDEVDALLAAHDRPPLRSARWTHERTYASDERLGSPT
jgi:hypothetical protein